MFYDFAAIKEKINEASEKYKNGDKDYMVPKCEKCGGVIKPDVVLYEEGLDGLTMQKSVKYISEADVLIIAGTSLAVYPAAGLIHYFKGNTLALVNRDATPLDSNADLVLHDSIGKVFSAL